MNMQNTLAVQTEKLLNPETISALVQRGLDAGTSIALAAMIFIIGMIVAGFARRAIRKAIGKNRRVDVTLTNFFSSIVYYAIVIVVLVSVLGQFGVETTSMVAALGAATLAIGLALQGTLSNLSAGVMIILFRPYSIGDYVEVADQSGSIRDINLFTTVLASADNKRVIIPNSSAWGAVITNYSVNGTRRVDFTFSIDYENDIASAMKVIEDTLSADQRVHKSPAVFTGVISHGDSSIDIAARVWCASEDYWGIYFDAMKNVKEAFDQNNISIPYPHQVEIAR